MQNNFNNAAGDAEQILKDLEVSYSREKDGTLVVDDDIDLSRRGLTRLPDLSRVIVKGDFACRHNQLESLEGTPQTIEGSLYVQDNLLTSLKGGPQSVGDRVYCYKNRLSDLKHAPQKFTVLKSDLGHFSSPEEIPEQLRTSPETEVRRAKEACRQLAENILHATVLQRPITPLKTLKFRTP